MRNLTKTIKVLLKKHKLSMSNMTELRAKRL